MINRFLIFFSLILLISTPAFAVGLSTTVAKQAYIVDFNTGQVLFAKNETERMPTSSMSKVMTMYMVFQALKAGKITKETEFEVSEKAWRMGGSKMFVEVGKRVKVEDLIRGVIIQSGNDATIVLAEGLAGTEETFALAMTRQAKALGMQNTNFMNASGWPDDNHYSTAQDLSILATALIRDFPEYYEYYSEKEFEFAGIKQDNRNPLLYRDIGADGIKTGHTEAAGYGLIGSGEKDGRRIIMVVNGLESVKERASESVRLFSWALNSFENLKIFSKNEVVENAPVSMGKAPSVPLAVSEDIIVTLPKMSRDQLEVEAIYTKPFLAPVEAGKRIGKLKLTIPGQEPLDYDLLTSSSVEELGFFAKMIEKAKMSVGGLLKKE
ncbi:MAG: D-alanyl-D-alanine carboxypeptidase family protein [Pseudomonadota bacterium]